jgi:hypothetical protein
MAQAVHAGPADPTRRLSSAGISCPKPAKTAARVCFMTDRSPFDGGDGRWHAQERLGKAQRSKPMREATFV